jgi:hypothetical protein
MIFQGPEERNCLQGKCKIKFIYLDPLLYFDPKQLFHIILMIKRHKCILSRELENTVATPELFLLYC